MTCPRCQGLLIRESLDELKCMNCGHRRYLVETKGLVGDAKIELGTQYCRARQGRGNCRQVAINGTGYCGRHRRNPVHDGEQPIASASPDSDIDALIEHVKAVQMPKVLDEASQADIVPGAIFIKQTKSDPFTAVIPDELDFRLLRTPQQWEQFVWTWQQHYPTYELAWTQDMRDDDTRLLVALKPKTTKVPE